jgi:hypothetical protein
MRWTAPQRNPDRNGAEKARKRGATTSARIPALFMPCCSCSCAHEHGYSPSAPVPPELQRLVPTVGIQPAQPLWHEWVGKLKAATRRPLPLTLSKRQPCCCPRRWRPLLGRVHWILASPSIRGGTGPDASAVLEHRAPLPPSLRPRKCRAVWIRDGVLQNQVDHRGDGAGRKRQFCTQGASRRKPHRDESAQRVAASKPYDVLMRSAALLATSEWRRETVQRGKTHCLLSFVRRHVACLCDDNSCRVPPLKVSLYMKHVMPSSSRHGRVFLLPGPHRSAACIITDRWWWTMEWFSLRGARTPPDL